MRSSPVPEIFRHRKRPEWGMAMLVEVGETTRTYQFEDGERRSIKAAFADRLLERIEPPFADETAIQRLIRGGRAVAGAAPKALSLELERAIWAHPDDPASYEVYADWLISRGDPRGDLMSLQAARAREPNNARIERAEKKLLAEHAAYFVPPSLASMLKRPRRKEHAESGYCEIRWHHGFIQWVRLARRSARLPHTVPELLDELLPHPSAQFLRGLTLGPLGGRELFDYRGLLETVASRAPRGLRVLEVADYANEHAELLFSRLGDVSGLLAALPELEVVKLRGGHMHLGRALELKKLRRLEIEAGTHLARRTLDRIAHARLPELDRLVLDMPALHPEANTLQRLIGQPRAHLGLRRCEGTASFVLPQLLASATLERMTSLDLRWGDLDDAGARILLDHADRFRKLERLDLRHNRLSQAMGDRLATALPSADLGSQRSGPLEVSEARVQGLARSPSSMIAARKLADPTLWLVAARDGRHLWGEYVGGDHYEVHVDRSDLQYGCTCPSPQRPCKHVLGLLLISAAGHALPERTRPRGIRNRCETDVFDMYRS